jgi:NDP-sugar pyrophosphorylase family protein
MPDMPDAIILCGGAGLRLRSVTGTAPKSMASVADRPFLELLLRQLERNRFRRVVLAVGYENAAICEHFGVRAFGLDLVYSLECSPLGTGGAMRNALDLLAADAPLVMNGDSYTDVNLRQLVFDHQESGADASVVVVPVEERDDCGWVSVSQDHRVAKFEEKSSLPGSGYFNAGVYVLSRSLLQGIPSSIQVSVEKELFPRWLDEGKHVRAFVHKGVCVDIGTPERYQRAQRSLAEVETRDAKGSER